MTSGGENNYFSSLRNVDRHIAEEIMALEASKMMTA